MSRGVESRHTDSYELHSTHAMGLRQLPQEEGKIFEDFQEGIKTSRINLIKVTSCFF